MNTSDIKIGDIVEYILYGVLVTKKVTTRNIYDIQRVLNMRKPVWRIK